MQPLIGTRTQLDLKAIARKAMEENGFLPVFSPQVEQELANLPRTPPAVADKVRDLRALSWSSIDNDTSRDLDQIEMAEALPGDQVRIRVAIADVDSIVKKGSAVDAHAEANTTSVYTGVVTFPMLPEVLSTDETSLNQDADRLAIVIEFVVKPDGSIGASDVYRASVRNKAKLAYNAVSDWLAGKGSIPGKVSAIPGMESQLRMQDATAQKLKALRHQNGALDLETLEATPVTADGEIVDLALTLKGRARELIEEFMVAANGVMARFLESHDRAGIARVVKTPERWERIVELAGAHGQKLPSEPSSAALAAFLVHQRESDPTHFVDLSLAVVKLMGPGEYILQRPHADRVGHFGLAVQDYTHSTAPNRRFSDLITQRLLKAVLADAPPPYAEAEISALAARCSEKEHDARSVERRMRKVAAAILLRHRIGETFDAIVTGATPKGVFVRLLKPPAEGRVVRGEAGLDVGEKLRVKLLSTDPMKGFIDFARAN